MNKILYPTMIAVFALLLNGCGGNSGETLLSGTDPGIDPGTDQDGNQGVGSEWQLVWSDEFEGTALGPDWSHELGDGSDQGVPNWGNGELQFYREENTSVAEGFLTIVARKEEYGGKSYTSSRLKTQGKQEFRFGKIEIRAKLPQGQGMWPALWMLGANITEVGWPASGEIDIMEMVGGQNRERTVFGTIHWNDSGHKYSGGRTTLEQGSFADDFHIFSIEWDSASIIWLVDGQRYHSEALLDARRSELKGSFFILVNIAVGGNLPGPPDSSTSFPQQMVIDYIRVYQEE